MIFNLKKRPVPQYGDTRIIKKFALLPIRIDIDRVVFLENYLVLQEYRFASPNAENITSSERWFDIKYATKNEESILNNKIV